MDLKIKFNPTDYPIESGVYLMKNDGGKVLYVGKAKNLRSRLSQYFKEEGKGDLREMIPILRSQISKIDVVLTLSDKEALLLENSLIKEHKPKYNVLLKDDKTYLSLYINTHDSWPKLELVRSSKGNGLFFGPYTSSFSARQTYETLLKTFPLRQCSNQEFNRRATPCILYDIKRCMAPCTGLCTKEEYDTQVKNIIRFLKGTNQGLLKELEAKMEDFSSKLEFEKAAIIHQQIKALKQVTEHHRYTTRFQIGETDVIAIYSENNCRSVCKMAIRNNKLASSDCFYLGATIEEEEEALCSFLLQHYAKFTPPPNLYLSIHYDAALEEVLNAKISLPQRGEKKRLVEMAFKNAKAFLEHRKSSDKQNEDLLLELEERCHLEHFPYHIECFDTSHMALENPVASVATFLNGKRSGKLSWVYQIKHSSQSEDYASMKEALTRRLTRSQKEDNLPNLIILDGGKGQLNLAQSVLQSLNIASIDLIAFAKENARHDKGLTKESIYTLNEKIELDPRSSLHLFLQRIRDEAHKMAIEYHRKRKRQSLLTSELDQIPGIGPAKKKALLRHFGSLEAIKKATIEQLMEVKGITEKLALQILKEK
jgi:excinuclease ABC subunit C